MVMMRRKACRKSTSRALAAAVLTVLTARTAARSFCQSCRDERRSMRRSVASRSATPLELLALPPLETYTSKGVLPAPGPTLPEGKQSVFDGTPLLQTDQAVEADGLLETFASRLVTEIQPLDLLSTFFLFLGFSLGFLDTRKRWSSYASDAITWWIYQIWPADPKLLPKRLAPGDAQDVERAEASWPQMRQLVKYLSTARIPDRLRAACAADAAEKADASLAPVAQQVLQACEKALPGAEEPLPAIDGEWECACDYFRNGNVIFVPMKLRGAKGDYIADGARHNLSDIARRREGSLVVADFCWKNVAGATGKGKWLVSVDGAFIAGQWRQDGVAEGPWSWYGRRKPDLSNPLPPEVARSQSSREEEDFRAPDLGSSIIAAARQTVERVEGAERASSSSLERREAVAQCWEEAAPQQPSGTGGDLAPSAVLRRNWLAAGEELRCCLGLSVKGLVPKEIQRAGETLTLLLLFLLSFFSARALNLALGNPADAVTWSLFAASYAVVLDVVLPSRQGFLGFELGEATLEQRRKRLQQLSRWEENGGLRRSGSIPREELLAAARRVLVLGADVRDSEIEELLKVWNPDLKRQVLRSSRLSKGAMITYENMSMVKGKEPRSIW